MKLYFYFLHNRDRGDVTIECKECDVIETGEGYRPVTEFPMPMWDRMNIIHKDRVGRISSFFKSLYIILKEPDFHTAAKAFRTDCNCVIRKRKADIEDAERDIKRSAEVLGLISQWEEDNVGKRN